MSDFNSILNLPQRCIVDKKLTKAFFLKNYVLNASEKKFLSEKIESMQWLAMISPNNANITAYKDDLHDFSLINVFVLNLNAQELNSDAPKAIQLLQKHLPDQALIIVENEFEWLLSACEKRINQADKNKRTVDNYFHSHPLSKLYKKPDEQSFFEALHYGALDKINLQTTYKSYNNAIVQLKAASMTGVYKQRSKVNSEKDMELIQLIEAEESEIAALKSQLKKENQLNNQVKINVAIQELKMKIEDYKKQLSEA